MLPGGLKLKTNCKCLAYRLSLHQIIKDDNGDTRAILMRQQNPELSGITSVKTLGHCYGIPQDLGAKRLANRGPYHDIKSVENKTFKTLTMGRCARPPASFSKVVLMVEDLLFEHVIKKAPTSHEIRDKEKIVAALLETFSNIHTSQRSQFAYSRKRLAFALRVGSKGKLRFEQYGTDDYQFETYDEPGVPILVYKANSPTDDLILTLTQVLDYYTKPFSI